MLIFTGKETHKFGEQRLWGTFGWGSVTVVSGWLIDWYSKGDSNKDYTPAIILWVILLLVDLFIACQIQVNTYFSCILQAITFMYFKWHRLHIFNTLLTLPTDVIYFSCPCFKYTRYDVKIKIPIKKLIT